MGEIVLHLSDWMSWADGTRRLTGPGIIDTNDQGQVLGVRPFGSTSPQDALPESDVAQEVATPVEVLQPSETQSEAVPPQVNRDNGG